MTVLTTEYQKIAQYHAVYSTYYITYQWWAKYDAQSIELNKTTVSIQQRIVKSSTITWYNSTQTMKCATGQGTATKSFTVTTGSAVNQTLSTNSFDITHESDGSYSTNWTCTIVNSYDDAQTHNVNAPVSLPTIPRATVPQLSLSSVNLDSASTQVITLNRASAYFTHTLYYQIGSGSLTTLAQGQTTSYNWSVPTTTILNAMPTISTTTVTVYCDTFQNDTQVGSRQSASFTVTTNATPIINQPTVVGIPFRRYKSFDLTFTISAGTGAKLSSVSIVSGDISTSAGNVSGLATVTKTVTGTVGGDSIVITATDTRGKSATVTIDLNQYSYVPYVLPTLIFKSSTRGNPTSDYSDIRCNYQGIVYSPYAQDSTITIAVYSGDTLIGSSQATAITSGYNNSFTCEVIATGNGTSYYARNSKYTVVATLSVYDDNTLVDTVTLTTEINRAMPIFHFGNDFNSTDIPHFDIEGHLIIHGEDKKIIWIDDSGQPHEMTYAKFIDLL